MNVVSLTITDLYTPDIKEFRKVLQPVIGRAFSVYRDRGYESRRNFEYLSNKGIDAIIPTRRNARSLSRSGGPARGRVVRRIKKIGLDEWKKEVQYDKRWRVEIFFSALKGTVGEVIMANKPVYQIQEAVMKIYAYFLMRKNTVVN
ncbi:MAG: transposase [Candidatus Thermoplasmatota archaeon]|jgi:hypothetical protein|nr:transposase [Candidatus Thermoplasmatota archaeon]